MRLLVVELEGDSAMDLKQSLSDRSTLEGSIRTGWGRDCSLNLTKRAGADIADGGGEIRVIEDIVGICSKREDKSFPLEELLVEAKVGVYVMRSV